MDSDSTECAICSDILENQQLESPPEMHMIQTEADVSTFPSHMTTEKSSEHLDALTEEEEAAEEEELGQLEERLAEEYKISLKKQKLSSLLDQFKDRYMR